MAETRNLVRIFVASPSDVQSERALAEEVVKELNTTIGDTYGIRLETKKWEKDTYPAIGEYSQDVINKQIGEYDIFVGIMKHKFGTPTQAAESGTEEEFNRAYDNFKNDGSCKNLMLFFSKESLPQNSDFDQFKKVLDFKTKIGKKGIYYKEYEDSNRFESTLRISLNKCLTDLFRRHIEKAEIVEEQYTSTLLSEEFNIYLNSSGNLFTHPSGLDITLDDIYIPLNLRIIDSESKTDKRTNIEILTSAIEGSGILYNIVGGESSGKTSLCKYIFKRYYNQELYPILINGSDINANIRKDNIIRIINEKIGEQYKQIAKATTLDKSKNDSFILIIDDFQKSAKGNDKYWKLLVSNLETLFTNIVIVGDMLSPSNELSANPPFVNFTKFSILEFGADFRSKLIEKWYSIGLDTSLESRNEMRKKVDDASKYIKTILGKNFIPSYPVYILGILQSLEGAKSGSENYSLHGFYYEHLINDALFQAVENPKNIGFYRKFLTVLCYSFFHENRKRISIDEFDYFYENYCNEHDVRNIGKKEVKTTFKKSKLLHFNSEVTLGHKYVYYFFVAKYIADNIDKVEIIDIVKKLCKRIFKNEFANIIMFITHLSKSPMIIQELVNNANDIFSEFEPSKLESEIENINKLILEIPNKVIREIDVDKERDDQLRLETELEEKQKEFDEDNTNYTSFSLDDDVTNIDLLAKMNLALKSIDLLGQLGIKYWGELESADKLNIVSAAYNLGLRTLSLNLKLLWDNKEDITEHIKKIVIDKYIKDKCDEWDPTLNKEKIAASARNFIISWSYLLSIAIIRRVSFSVGDENLKPTFSKVLDANPYNSYKLINASIELNYPGIPYNLIKQYSEDMSDNKMCHTILRDLVVHHMYRFDIDHTTRSQITNLNLGLSMETQRYIQSSSQIKR